jgi:hypothetical protein
MPAFLTVLKLRAAPALTKDVFNEVEVLIVAQLPITSLSGMGA